MLLTMLRAIYDVRREAMPELLQVALNRTVPALLGITHGDGGLGSWQGSGAVSDLLVEAVIKASGVRSRLLRQARVWGSHRVTAGPTVLRFTAAPPPVAPLKIGRASCREIVCPYV